jgi:hypothetical protein
MPPGPGPSASPMAPLMSGHQVGRVISLSRWVGFLLLFVGILVTVIGVLPSGAPDAVTANFVGKLLAVIGLAGILLAGGLGLEFAAPVSPGTDPGIVQIASTRMKIDTAMILGAAAFMVWLLTTI